jgi:hypothetical protein
LLPDGGIEPLHLGRGQLILHDPHLTTHQRLAHCAISGGSTSASGLPS